MPDSSISWDTMGHNCTLQARDVNISNGLVIRFLRSAPCMLFYPHFYLAAGSHRVEFSAKPIGFFVFFQAPSNTHSTEPALVVAVPHDDSTPLLTPPHVWASTKPDTLLK